MPRRKGAAKDRDGVFLRKDRPGKFFGSWIDASGRRRKRKLDASTLQQAQTLLSAEKMRVDKQRTLGYAPATKESFAALLPRYLKHQKPRLTQRSYERTEGIVKNQLRPTFGEMKLGMIRRADIQQYVTERAGEVSAGSVVKELNCLKHLLGLAVEWELIPLNPALKIKPPRVPAGGLDIFNPQNCALCLRRVPSGSVRSLPSQRLPLCGAPRF